MAEVWEEDRRIRKFLDPKRKPHKKVESLVKFIDGAASADHVTRLFAKYSTGACVGIIRLPSVPKTQPRSIPFARARPSPPSATSPQYSTLLLALPPSLLPRTHSTPPAHPRSPCCLGALPFLFRPALSQSYAPSDLSRSLVLPSSPRPLVSSSPSLSFQQRCS